MSRRRATVNQHGLARELGLSQFTVSEALRGSPKVAAGTRARVVEAAERMGYRVNASARATRTGRFGGIAVLRGPLASVYWFPLDLLFGIEYQLDRLSQRLVMARVPPGAEADESVFPRLLRELSVDGVLGHCVPEPPAQLPELLKRYAIPAVWLNVKRPHDSVYPDDVENGYRAARHVIDRGHRRVAFVPALGAGHYSAPDRAAGYRNAMEEHGLRPEFVERPAETDPRDPALRGTLRALLRREPRPTAIVTYSFEEAALTLHVAAEAGLSVPRDLSVICAAADNLSLGSDVLGITSVEIAWMPLGCHAVDLLMRKIAAPHRPLDSIAVPPRFREGRTTGPAPGKGGG